MYVCVVNLIWIFISSENVLNLVEVPKIALDMHKIVLMVVVGPMDVWLVLIVQGENDALLEIYARHLGDHPHLVVQGLPHLSDRDPQDQGQGLPHQSKGQNIQNSI